MRIGVDARSIGSAEVGPGTYARQLVQEMSRQTPRWTFCLYWGQRTPRPVQPVGANVTIRVLGRPGGRKLGNLLFEQVLLPSAVRRDACDLLWSPAFVLPLWRTTPQVVTMHDIIPLRFSHEETLARRAVYHRLLRVNGRKADRIITVSHNSARDLVEHLGVDPAKVVVVHNGLESTFRPLGADDRDTLQLLLDGLGIRRPYALSTAGLLPRKNAHGVLEAFSRVFNQDEGDGLNSLVFTGKTTGGGKEEYIAGLRKRASCLGIGERVHFVGHRDREEVRLLYGGSLFSIDASYYEGFGFPVLESMACGCPVIASRVSSLPEVAGNAAILVDPQSVDGLAAAMDRLIRDASLCCRLRDRGIVRAGLFSWEESARLTLDVFREAVENHELRKEVAA